MLEEWLGVDGCVLSLRKIEDMLQKSLGIVEGKIDSKPDRNRLDVLDDNLVKQRQGHLHTKAGFIERITTILCKVRSLAYIGCELHQRKIGLGS